MVCDLERRVRLAKANVESMMTLMSGWCQAPLYRRREDKKEQSLLNLDVRGGREGREGRWVERMRAEGDLIVLCITISTLPFCLYEGELP